MVNDSKTLCKAVKMLLDNGVESAQFEVRQLAEFVGSAEELLSAVDRRLRGEPLQYILGEWEFWGLPFKVGKGVLQNFFLQTQSSTNGKRVTASGQTNF